VRANQTPTGRNPFKNEVHNRKVFTRGIRNIPIYCFVCLAPGFGLGEHPGVRAYARWLAAVKNGGKRFL